MSILVALALSLAPAAQQVRAPTVPMRPQFEYLRPFRAPDKNLQPPLDLYDELRRMRAIARDPAAAAYVDKEGREVCDSVAWRDALAKAQIKATRMAGYLAIVCQESGSAEDRALGFYGSYWLDAVEDTIAIMALIPGEPVPQIREEAMQRALAFLRVHLGKTRGGPTGPRPASAVDFSEGRALGSVVYDDADAPLYDFDLAPWCALLECEQARDQAQGLWFLRELVLIRKRLGPESLALVKDLVPALTRHQVPEVRKLARAFLAAVDPKARPAPGDDASTAAVLAWVEAIYYDIFPPIRRVSAGRVDLYPSADLDRIVAVGKDVLERDAIGSTASGTAGGIFYRGFKVQRLPKPLDLLGLPLDAVITHINGAPVFDSRTVLDTIRELAGPGRAFMVEFVVNEKRKAMEYRLR